MYDDWGERCDAWRGIRSDVVDVQGTAVHLLRADAAGPAGSPTRPQLLVHGLGGSSLNWIEVMGELATRGPVIAPDLPGFGRTEPPTSRHARVTALPGFLRALLDALHLDEVEVHANSMGGLISTLFAARHPQRVARLVLVDPALPGPRKQLHRLNRTTLAVFAPFVVPRLGRAVLGRLYSSRTTEQLLDESLQHVHADADRLRPELREVLLDNLRFGQDREWRLDAFAANSTSVVEAMLASSWVLRAVDRVQAPTLVVWGDQDELIGRPVIDALARRRPDWPLEVLDGMGHMVAMEAPSAYLEAVGDWLDGDTDDDRLAEPA